MGEVKAWVSIYYINSEKFPKVELYTLTGFKSHFKKDFIYISVVGIYSRILNIE